MRVLLGEKMLCHDVKYFFWEDVPSKDFYLISYEMGDDLRDKFVYEKMPFRYYKEHKCELKNGTFRWSYTKFDADIVRE